MSTLSELIASAPWLPVVLLASLMSKKVRTLLGWLLAAVVVVLVLGVGAYLALHAAVPPEGVPPTTG